MSDDEVPCRQSAHHRDEAVVAVVQAWTDLQRRPFVMPAELTELAIALDELTRRV